MKLLQEKPEPMPALELPKEPIKVALVLGGGGSKGLAHVGVIQELELAGIRPDLVVGCSSGSIVGVLYADQPHVKHLETLLINIQSSDLMDFSLFSPRFAIVKGIRFKTFLEQTLQSKKFHHLKIPFIAVATDLKTGELIQCGGGDLLPTIMASSAVPGIFRPVFYKGRYLVDGGVVDPIPVQVAKQYGAHVIIAVDVGDELSHHNPNNFFDVAQRSLSISYRKLSERVVRDADVVIQMNFQGLGMFCNGYNQKIYDHGRKMTRKMLPQIEQAIRNKLTHTDTHSAWINSNLMD